MAENCDEFKWQDLLLRIRKRNVIPVIGEGLYWVRTPDEGDVLLYPYLAEKFVYTMKLPLTEGKESFHQAVFRYLETKPDDYLAVDDFLVKQFETLTLVPDSPLKQLARIRSFSLFINSGYDDYLEHTLKRTRTHPTEVVLNTPNEKGANELRDSGIFKQLKAGQQSLIFNIYGNAGLIY